MRVVVVGVGVGFGVWVGVRVGVWVGLSVGVEIYFGFGVLLGVGLRFRFGRLYPRWNLVLVQLKLHFLCD